MIKKYDVTVKNTNGKNTKLEIAVESQDMVYNPKQETLECLFEFLKNEYNVERNKKASLENRAIGLLAVITAIVISLLSKDACSQWIELWKVPLCYQLFLKVTMSICAIGGCLFACYYLCHIIKTKKLESANVVHFYDKDHMEQEKMKILKNLNAMYFSLIAEHSKANDKNAKRLELAYKSLLIMVLGTILYTLL